MIWLTLRQFRVQTAAGGIALAAFVAYVVRLGADIREARDDYLARCDRLGDCADLLGQLQSEYGNALLYVAGVVMLLPFLVGMFWGAPLVARELETGTFRLVWTQSVRRTRWLVVKLLCVGLAVIVAVGLVSLALTWAAGPIDHLAGDRFTRVVFGARHVVPIAHAVFALILGVVVGMVVRRTVPAMALALLLVTAVQLGMPAMVRPHLMPPVTETVPITAEVIREQTRGLGDLWNRPTVKSLSIPGAWVASTTELRTESGESLDVEVFNDCIFGKGKDAAECLGELDLHVVATYQPNERYWTFQRLESAIYLAVAGVLAGLAGWRIRSLTSRS
jgi:ABC-2 family transporter protein